MHTSRMDEILKVLNTKNIDYRERTIPYHRGVLKLLYIKELVNNCALAEQIIKPLIEYCANERKPLNARHTVENVIYAAECRIEENAALVTGYILSGMVVMLFSNAPQYVVVNIKEVPHRGVTTPQITYTMRGPKDCFVENLEVNLSLIRYRIKDPNIRIDMLKIGERTKTNVAVIYIEDIANNNIVSEVKKRLDAIKTDSTWGTGEIQQFLQNSKRDLFPQTGTTERSDWACEALMEGRVVILADGGQIALLAPYTFPQAMVPCDDRYDNKFFGLFSHILRYMAAFISLCFSSYYIAAVSFHTYILPVDYGILISKLRQNVLFAPLVEVLLLEFLVELIREAILRVPSKIGAAIGVVGAIVIGQAATSAGVFSPLLLIIVAASLMASFAMPDYFAAHPFRILKFFVIIMTGFLGFYGLSLALTVIVTNMVSINSFGVPYMAPFAPYNRYDFRRAMMFTRSTSPWREQFLRTKDNTRTDFYHQNMEPR